MPRTKNPAPQTEQSFETAMDEFFKGLSGPQLAAWLANIKRTYDTYQEEDLENRSVGRDHRVNVNSIAVQALQNAVETANMVSKQAVKHSDVATCAIYSIFPESDAFLASILAAQAEAKK